MGATCGNTAVPCSSSLPLLLDSGPGPRQTPTLRCLPGASPRLAVAPKTRSFLIHISAVHRQPPLPERRGRLCPPLPGLGAPGVLSPSPPDARVASCQVSPPLSFLAFIPLLGVHSHVSDHVEVCVRSAAPGSGHQNGQWTGPAWPGLAVWTVTQCPLCVQRSGWDNEAARLKMPLGGAGSHRTHLPEAPVERAPPCHLTCRQVCPQSDVMYISSLYSTSCEPRFPGPEEKGQDCS